MPAFAPSSARHFVSMMTPALEAQYAASSGIAQSPAIEAVDTIEPPPRSRKCGHSALETR